MRTYRSICHRRLGWIPCISEIGDLRSVCKKECLLDDAVCEGFFSRPENRVFYNISRITISFNSPMLVYGAHAIYHIETQSELSLGGKTLLQCMIKKGCCSGNTKIWAKRWCTQYPFTISPVTICHHIRSVAFNCGGLRLLLHPFPRARSGHRPPLGEAETPVPFASPFAYRLHLLKQIPPSPLLLALCSLMLKQKPPSPLLPLSLTASIC